MLKIALRGANWLRKRRFNNVGRRIVVFKVFLMQEEGGFCKRKNNSLGGFSSFEPIGFMGRE